MFTLRCTYKRVKQVSVPRLVHGGTHGAYAAIGSKQPNAILVLKRYPDKKRVTLVHATLGLSRPRAEPPPLLEEPG